MSLLLLAGLARLAVAQDTPAPDTPVELGPAPPVAKSPPRLAIAGTQDFRFRYYQSDALLPDFEDRPRLLDHIEAVERLDLTARYGQFQLALRGDAAALFLNRYRLDGELVHENVLYRTGVRSPFPDALITLEKVSLTHRTGRSELTLGDSYAAFGRGYALNLAKNTEVDVDTSLRGLQGRVSVGNWDLQAVSGLTNPQQIALENPNVGIEPDRYHAITGARVSRYGLGPLNLGVHGAMFQFRHAADDLAAPLDAWTRPVDAATWGGSVQALGIGGVDLYAEADGTTYLTDGFGVDGGWAGYLSATAYPGKAVVLVEARRAFHAEAINTYARLNDYEVVSGPSLEYDRVITEDSAAAVDSNDIVGGRVRVDLALGGVSPDGEFTTFSPYLSVATFRDVDLGGLHFNETPETIVHPIVGVQYIRHEFTVLANAGARVDVRDGDGGADRMQHLDLAMEFPLSGPVSLAIDPTFMAFQWGDNGSAELQQHDFVDVANALAVKVGSPWAFILYTDYSDNPLVDSVGNLTDTLYAAGEAQWKPGPATTLKVFYGAYRAGIRCAGGQCRKMPGFEGAKLSFSTTF